LSAAIISLPPLFLTCFLLLRGRFLIDLQPLTINTSKKIRITAARIFPGTSGGTRVNLLLSRFQPDFVFALKWDGPLAGANGPS
jgi:hypothetical protein